MAGKKQPTFDVFVGNLPSESNERNVGKFFTPYGEIAGIYVKESKTKGPNNKYAFVNFHCQQDAERAIREMDKKKINGVEIVVKKKEDRRTFSGQPGGGMKKQMPDADFLEGGGAVPGVMSPFMAGGQLSPQAPVMEGEKEIVLITHVESPITLYVQIVSEENTNKIFNITEQLSALCPSAQPLDTPPDIGKVYACMFKEDKTWYRCAVKQSFGSDKFKIQYVDYGNMEEVTGSSLVEIPPALATIKGLAMKVVLHNTRAKDLSDKMGIEFLKGLIDTQMAHLQRTCALADGTGFYGIMWVNNLSLGDAMMQAGYCVATPKMGMKKGGPPGVGKMSGMGPVGRGAGPMNTDAFSEGMFGQPGPQMMGPSMFPAPSGERPHSQQHAGMKKGPGRPGDHRNMAPPYSGPLGNQGPQGFQGGPPLMGPGKPHNMGFPTKIGGQQGLVSQAGGGGDKKLQSELTKKKQENDQLRNEKNKANMQLDYMKTKVKTLQEEFAVSAAKLQEETLSKRLTAVISLAAVVRKLREQFPTGGQPCLLEEAITLSCDDDRVDNSKCRSLAEVGSALACYKAAQNEIRKTKEQSELQELIKARDETRRGLHSKLCVCLEEMDKMPLEARSKQVQDIQTRLSVTYGDYLKVPVQDCPNLENMVPGFKSWKVKKDVEFSDVRTATDFCEEALQTALSQFKQRISVQGDVCVDRPDVDMDDLMKTYAHALQREINITDLVHSKDASLITTVIAAIRKELQSEATNLDNFTILRQEFVARRDVIAPWLETAPSFTDLQENRKTLRSLKSKLRHLQADKLDLEESGSEGELDSLKQEEEQIRAQLQETLIKSESLTDEVAELANSNFPELLVQYPDLGIDSYLLYKGLVKSNRDIDHYLLRPSFRPGLHQSVFNGEKVLLQEFHINDSDHCSREDFTGQLLQYKGDSNTIQAVFFNKSERQAYVQSALEDGELMEVACKSRTLTLHDIQQVALSLVQEVSAVHGRGAIHGEVTPQSVLMKEDNSITLLYPDFSRLPGERIGKRYVTDSGMVFQSPELQFSSPDSLGQAADVYNTVLTIFWLHYPDGKPANMTGSLANKTRKLSPSLQLMFDSVLGGKSATRVSCEQMLQLDYFTKPLPTVISPAVSPPPISEQQAAPMAISTPPTQRQVPREPIIKGTDEPMEIGVFNPDDYMSEPTMLPPGQPIVSSSVDTDNSWTTEESVSTSAGSSRGNSPLDTVLEQVPKSDSQHTVTSETGADQESGEPAVNEWLGQAGGEPAVDMSPGQAGSTSVAETGNSQGLVEAMSTLGVTDPVRADSVNDPGNIDSTQGPVNTDSTQDQVNTDSTKDQVNTDSTKDQVNTDSTKDQVNTLIEHGPVNTDSQCDGASATTSQISGQQGDNVESFSVIQENGTCSQSGTQSGCDQGAVSPQQSDTPSSQPAGATSAVSEDIDDDVTDSAIVCQGAPVTAVTGQGAACEGSIESEGGNS